ncbi:MAG: hypothetical protein WCK15_17180 [Pirellula sp.]
MLELFRDPSVKGKPSTKSFPAWSKSTWVKFRNCHDDLTDMLGQLAPRFGGVKKISFNRGLKWTLGAAMMWRI